jgi:DNA-binding NtrC family response regulator
MSGTASIQSIESSLDAFRRELTDSAHIVLVAEKEEVRARIAHILEKRGLTVHPFENAAFFLEWLGTERISLGIFQVGDASIDGLKLIEQLREKDPLAEVMAIANQPDAALTVACMEKGTQDLFALPLALENLFVSRAFAAIERFRRAAVDQVITDKFQNFASTLIRKDDVKHRGAVDRFAKHLADYKSSLAHSAEILLLVANAFAGERTKSFLESEGFTVALTSSKADAVAAAEKGEVRLVLADTQLPDGTAFDAFKEISRLHPDVEFLIVSPAHAADIALEAMHAGARDCVLKPHEGLEAIQQKVKRALRLQTKHLKHQRLVDELRKLCAELVAIDAEEQKLGSSVMIKVDPSKSAATLNRFLAELDREEKKRIREAGRYTSSTAVSAK